MASPALPRSAATYLPQGVDVNLPPFSALAEVHGGSHQQNIGDAITVDIKGVDLTAVVRADLKETEEGVGAMLPARRGTATLPDGDISSLVPAMPPSLELQVQQQPGHPQLPVDALHC